MSQRVLELRGDHARRTELLANRIAGPGSREEAPTAATAATTAELQELDTDPLDEQATIADLEELEIARSPRIATV